MALKWASGEAENIPGPGIVAIETTVRCNLRCPMCPRTGAGYPAEDMADAMLWPLLDDVAAMGGDLVWLNGLGEPFLDPRLFSVLDRCRSLGLATVVATNGTHLHARNRERLLQSGCDHLIVSIDGTTQATYEQHRPGGTLSQVEANVRALAQDKQAAGAAPMSLTVQMVRMPGTLPEEAEFLRRWTAVAGVDHVRCKDEEFGAEGYALGPQGPVARRSPCRILWTGPLIIRWNGDVAACHPRAARGLHVGSLVDQRLPDLWEGPRLRHLRRIHGTGEESTDARCASCPVSRPQPPFVLGGMVMSGRRMYGLLPTVERWSRRLRLPFLENPGAPPRP